MSSSECDDYSDYDNYDDYNDYYDYCSNHTIHYTPDQLDYSTSFSKNLSTMVDEVGLENLHMLKNKILTCEFDRVPRLVCGIIIDVRIKIIEKYKGRIMTKNSACSNRDIIDKCYDVTKINKKYHNKLNDGIYIDHSVIKYNRRRHLWDKYFEKYNRWMSQNKNLNHDMRYKTLYIYELEFDVICPRILLIDTVGSYKVEFYEHIKVQNTNCRTGNCNAHNTCSYCYRKRNIMQKIYTNIYEKPTNYDFNIKTFTTDTYTDYYCVETINIDEIQVSDKYKRLVTNHYYDIMCTID
jgi:hypothetical protein